MAEETQYTANTGMQTISTANSNLDGTGTISSAIITGGAYGTLIKTVTVIATGTTTQGMVRLFLYDGTNTRLVSEIEIPAVVPSSTDPAFRVTVPVDFALDKDSWSLKASTENAETFNVIAEGLDWTYYASSVRPESGNYTANSGYANITTANTYRNGTGTMGTVLTAASNGTLIERVTIKSLVNTSAGMIRLFLYDGSSVTMMLREIPVIATTKSATAHSFSAVVDFEGKGFALKSGWVLKASTEIGESFNVIAEGLNWAYPA
jgi:hypothetical protein